ncbi:MAG: HD domain-containing protein [Gemmatimonadetes bacterium]|nr:HD domain-containing protein [Gemmatimonadota bacterium]
MIHGARGHTATDARHRSTLVLVTVLIALIHFGLPTTTHSLHSLHIVLRKLYFLPPVLAAIWFGRRGAFWATLVVSGLFLAHAATDWPNDRMEQANQLGELLGFWVLGMLAGHLFDRQHSLMVRIATAHAETIDGLVSALDLREHHTGMHSQRVREYTLLMADRWGIDDAQRQHISYGALLHDIGKIAVPDHILLKPGRLTEDEWAEIRRHPAVGYRILRRIAWLREAARMVHAHHERFDGGGYPRGLAGPAIPLGARLFAVADAYDALTSERPYRAPLPYAEAVEEIGKGEGTQFDPEAIACFLQIPQGQLARVAARWRDVAAAAPDPHTLANVAQAS